LQNQFRNICRKPRSHSSGLTFTPPAKRKKPDSPHHGLGYGSEILDTQTYEGHQTQLTKQLNRPIQNKLAIASLMAETAANRRKWILVERPSVKVVTNKFPPLKEFDLVCINYYYMGV